MAAPRTRPDLLADGDGRVPDYPHPVRTTPAVRGIVTTALLVAALAACGAAPRPDVPIPPSPSATAPVVVPSDGVSLAALGFTYGPVDRVFVPFGARIGSRVDQPNNVTVVMTSPPAADLVAFYRRTAAANGFAVTAEDPATTTMTFTGFGWTAAFTGDAQASALLLRPAD